jgi:uncharacterized repeat protein (TIGR03803 family)
MTQEGGTDSAGTIFKFTPAQGLTKIHNFIDSSDGGYPFGDLLLATDSNFYGMTYGGGKYNLGTFFRCSPSGSFTKLVDFNDTNGANPTGSMMQASDGNLYGMTYEGGEYNVGTIFKYSLSGNFTVLLNFNDTNGAFGEGTLMEASDGNLYGMTYLGGAYGWGSIFKYTLTDTLTTVYNLTGTTGYAPLFGKLIEVDNLTTGLNIISEDMGQVSIFPNPTTGIFTINFVGAQNFEPKNIKIYNVLGEKVYSSNYTLTTKHYSLDLSSNPNGIYFYRVVSENGGLVGEGKLVIER